MASVPPPASEATSDFLKRTSREYAIYTALDRAIPRVQDGLKHGQRVALWLLSKQSEKMKTNALVGKMMESLLYVHGDASAADTISLLAAPFKNNVPLITGLGAFGSRVHPGTEGIGAPRYTEVRRSKAAEAFLYNDLDIAPMEPNYDESTESPEFFLPLIPTVLLNGVRGQTLGYSTEILPRDLATLIGAVEDALMGKPIRDLPPRWTSYDVTVHAEGPSKWRIEGKAEIIDTSTVRITELPPELKLDAEPPKANEKTGKLPPPNSFRERLRRMEESEDIQSFTDRSTDRIDITVKMKRGSIKDWTPDDAIETFKVHDRVTERIVVIDWNGTSIRTYEDPKELVADFANWRLGWHRARFERRRAEAVREQAYWRAIEALVKDGFPKRLGGFEDRSAVEADVQRVAAKAKVELDAQQMDRVVTLPTYRWNKQAAAEVAAKVSELTARITEIDSVLADGDKLIKVYLNELSALKKAKL